MAVFEDEPWKSRRSSSKNARNEDEECRGTTEGDTGSNGMGYREQWYVDALKEYLSAGQ